MDIPTKHERSSPDVPPKREGRTWGTEEKPLRGTYVVQKAENLIMDMMNPDGAPGTNMNSGGRMRLCRDRGVEGRRYVRMLPGRRGIRLKLASAMVRVREREFGRGLGGESRAKKAAAAQGVHRIRPPRRPSPAYVERECSVERG